MCVYTNQYNSCYKSRRKPIKSCVKPKKNTNTTQ